jgi:hypothetical protein
MTPYVENMDRFEMVAKRGYTDNVIPVVLLTKGIVTLWLKRCDLIHP